MIDQLIVDGEKLQGQVKSGTIGRFYSGVEFEKWVAQTIIFLEKNFKDSSLTVKAIEKSKDLNPRSSVHTFEFLLGVLKALKED